MPGCFHFPSHNTAHRYSFPCLLVVAGGLGTASGSCNVADAVAVAPAVPTGCSKRPLHGQVASAAHFCLGSSQTFGQ